MFAQMVSGLKRGILPDNVLLGKRFEAALVKKMGVIRTPYSFWPADTKINPPVKQLLWAAILLQDKENFCIIEAVISSELEEKLRAKGQPVKILTLDAKVQELLQDYIHEFMEFAPNNTFRASLKRRVENLIPDQQDSKI